MIELADHILEETLLIIWCLLEGIPTACMEYMPELQEKKMIISVGC